MSWFSRSFSMREEERGLGGDEGDEDDQEEEEEEEEEEERKDALNLAAIASATGASVKEDLSNLRKTFSRQLWGVASFLAPPPLEKSSTASERGGGIGGSQEQGEIEGLGNIREVRSSSGGVESESESGRGFSTDNLGPVNSNFSAVGGGTSGGTSMPEENNDPRHSAASPDALVENALSEANRGPDRPRLTGLRSDFAELRGTMATGFSRISSVIRVVAGDDDDSGGDEDEELLSPVSARESSHPLSSPAGGDQHVNSPRLGLDAFLKPLFGNILMREESSGEKGDIYSEGNERAETKDAGKSHGEGESKFSELESLPAAIASGIDGLSKFASSLLQIVGDEEDEDKEDALEDQNLAVGLTEAVVTFARNIAMHPETWLEFQLTEDDANDDFVLTNAQKEHVHALEVVAPGLEALKIELCPNHMTEERFWKIYFVLMHSRLSANEALMLSTQQVVRARQSMLQELQKREPQTDGLDASQEDLMNEKVGTDAVAACHLENSKQVNEEFGSNLLMHPISTSDSTLFEDTRQHMDVSEADHLTTGSREQTEPIEPKSEPGKERFSMPNMEDETEVDEWPEEEHLTKHHEVGGARSHLDMSNIDDEDVSFSDLEEDESSDKAACTSETVTSSCPKGSGSIIPSSSSTFPLVTGETSSSSTQGDGTPRKSSDFNDWLTVDQDDVASAGSSSP